MKKAIVIKNRHQESYGTMSTAIMNSGYDVLDFSDVELMKEYDYLIVGHSKLFPKFETNAKIAWWMGDFRHPEQIFTKDQIDRFDVIFTCSGEVIEEYERFFEKPTFYMPQVGLDRGYFDKPKEEINHDVLFIGHLEHKKYHFWRNKIIDSIKKDYKVRVINIDKTTANQEYLYRASKFNLSLTLPWKLTTSNRLYNILASGGFALVSYFPEMERLFENHRHLVWFKDEKELKLALKQYSDAPISREYVKNNALQLSLEKHTAKHRLDNIFDIMEGKETKFRGFL